MNTVSLALHAKTCKKQTKKNAMGYKHTMVKPFRQNRYFLQECRKKNEAFKEAATVKGFKFLQGPLNTVVDKAVNHRILLQNSQRPQDNFFIHPYK